MRYTNQSLRFNQERIDEDDLNMTLTVYDKDSIRKQRNTRTHGRKRDEERRDRRNSRWSDE